MRGQEIERLNRDIMDVLSQKDLLEKEVARLAAEIVMVRPGGIRTVKVWTKALDC